MLSRATNILGVPVVLVKICLFATIDTVNSQQKNLLNLLPKKPPDYIYAAALKLKLHPFVITVTTALRTNGN